jgi:drug/metabolite transporter (DMT)-like permease
MKEKKLFAVSLMTAVGAIWGGAFVVMKDTLVRLDVNSFLAWRFIFATLLLIVIRPRVLKQYNKVFLKKGVIIGLFLGSGYIFQSLGLTHTTVGKTGFITGLYVVLTPLVAAIVLRKNINRWEWSSVAIATIGLALLSFKGFSIGFGEFLVLVSALLFALHIVSLGEWASGLDTYALTVLQLGTCAVMTFLASLKGGFHTPPDAGVWEAIIYTAIFATSIAFIVQTWAQSSMRATTVAVILTTEVPFAAVFGIWILHEELTLRIALGGFLVLVAMYLIILFDNRKAVDLESYHD